MPWTPEDANRFYENEQDIEEVKGNITLQERQKMKRAPRGPAINRDQIIKMEATYCAMVWSWCGDFCPHYMENMKLLQIIKSRQSQTRQECFTPYYCRKLIHAIIDDSRFFFSQEMSPNDFRNKVQLPVSYMGNWLHKVMTQNSLHIPDLPSE